MFAKYLSVLLLVAVMVACNRTPTQERELAEQQRAWTAARPTAYAFRYRVSCFCANGMVRYRVRVRDGRVIDAAQIDPLPSVASFPAPSDGYLTVDSLFAWARRAYERRADRVAVSYDDKYHYPTKIQIDWRRDAIDDEMSVEADGLVTDDAR
jgi:hypothetical protein